MHYKCGWYKVTYSHNPNAQKVRLHRSGARLVDVATIRVGPKLCVIEPFSAKKLKPRTLALHFEACMLCIECVIC